MKAVDMCIKFLLALVWPYSDILMIFIL